MAANSSTTALSLEKHEIMRLPHVLTDRGTEYWGNPV
jgi:hypothetical protein